MYISRIYFLLFKLLHILYMIVSNTCTNTFYEHLSAEKRLYDHPSVIAPLARAAAALCDDDDV